MEQKSRCEGNREIKLELAFTLKNTLNTLNDSLNLLRTDPWGTLGGTREPRETVQNGTNIRVEAEFSKQVEKQK